MTQFKKKIEKPGHAGCSLCCKEINDSTKGSHALLAHCKTEKTEPEGGEYYDHT